METPDKIFLSWSGIEEYIYAVEKWVLLNKNLKYVTGPARGGLIPAVLLSHKLGIDYISLTSAKLFPEKVKAEILLIDDICDSGETFIGLQDQGFTEFEAPALVGGDAEGGAAAFKVDYYYDKKGLIDIVYAG